MTGTCHHSLCQPEVLMFPAAPEHGPLAGEHVFWQLGGVKAAGTGWVGKQS